MPRRSFFVLLIAVMLLNHLLGGLLTLAYFAFVDPEPLVRVLSVLRGGAGLPWGLCLPTLLGLAWLYLGFLHRLSRLPDDEKAVDTLLNIPAAAARLTLMHWGVVGALFAGLFRLAGGPVSEAGLLFLGTLGVSGLATAAVMYPSVELVVQRLLPRWGSAAELERVLAQPRRVPVRLLLVGVQMGGLPLLLFAGAAWMSRRHLAAYPPAAQHLRHMVFVVVVAALGNLLAAGMVWQSVVRPLQRLAHAMERVLASGDLSLRLHVYQMDEFGQLAVGLNRMLAGLQEHWRVRELFGRYLSPEVAQEVLAYGPDRPPTEVEASVLFVDMRGFTRLAESLPPAEVFQVLNGFFELVIPPLLEQGGVINKFGGDAVLAIFGAPVPQPDHARRAVEAALAVLGRLPVAQLTLRRAGLPDFTVGIGIASGRVMAGNVGTPVRLEYTVLGDAVNLAARLEDLTRIYQAPLLICEQTYRALPTRQQWLFSSLGQVCIHGREQLCRVFAFAAPHVVPILMPELCTTPTRSRSAEPHLSPLRSAP